ncbi:MAG: SDR family oxidoreductase [Armatimonadota bacterium]|nr:MAG: SDR family oxidoreductase [Armatimonadota bacterium]
MSAEPRTAVITGGAGFLGSHLCDALVKRGYRVICLDNLITGDEANVQHLQSNPRFAFRRHDVSEPFDVDEPVDCVLHFASPASPVDFPRHAIEILKVGSAGTHNALEVARDKGARFLLASTSEVYGDPEVHPQTEEYRGNVNPIGPRSCYDEAKRFAEALTSAYRRMHGVGTGIARIFNTYGPRMRLDDGRVVPNFIAQALRGKPVTVYGDGSHTRSFCYVSDLVDGLLRLLDSAEAGPVNIGNDKEMRVIELARLIIPLTGSNSRIEFVPPQTDDPRARRPDLTMARERLGYEPRVSPEEGLSQTIEWFKARLAREQT